MATNPPKRQAPKPNRSVIQWLLDSDPSIRWQVMRDLTDAPADEVADERAKVATEGAGRRPLAMEPITAVTVLSAGRRTDSAVETLGNMRAVSRLA